MNKTPYHFGKNSASDWLVIVAVFTILSVIFVAAAFYQFSNLRSDKAVERSAVATSTVVALDHTKLDEVVKYFTERQQKFNQIKTTKPRFVDPSR